MIKLLLVEDNEPYLKTLDLVFKKEDLKLFLARDGEEALRIAREEKPDIIISDLMMPKMSGDKLCEAIKSDPELSIIYFIMLTALSDTKNVVQGLANGADDYLIKPCNYQEILARVKVGIRKIKNQRENLRHYGLNTIQQLAVTANHEINTPLQTIISTAEYLILSIPDCSSEIKEKLRFIIESAAKIHTITRKLENLKEISSKDYIKGGPKMIDLSKSIISPEED